MKDGRTELSKAVSSLSDAQLNFKLSSDSWSIKQHIYNIAASEKNSWNMLAIIMKTAPNPEKRALITLSDDQLIALVKDPSSNILASEFTDTKNGSFKSANEALESFKQQRTDHIKYMKLSTEDLRDHVVQMPFGWIDCYQLCLMIAAHSNRHITEIKELRCNPKFPFR